MTVLDEVIRNVISAVSLGGIYALAALGIALIFGVMRLINFAHGELIMTGGYALWLLQPYPWPVTVLATIVIVGATAVLMERIAFRPVRGAAPATLLITSFFVSSLLQNSANVVFDSRPKGISVLNDLLGEVQVGGIGIVKLDIVTVLASLMLLTAVALFLTRTLIGIQLRAASENFTMARLLGVRGNRVIPAAFLVSGILAGIVAILEITRTGSVDPTIGQQPAVIGFVATVLGGMGSLDGAVAAGFILGGITVGLEVVLPQGASSYRDAFVFGSVICLLIWKPGGLLPAKFRDRV